MEIPQLLDSLTTEEFRQKLAGLSRETRGHTDHDVEDMAIRFASILPLVFGHDLDRLTLWNRIGSALTTSAAKTVDGDIGFFVQSVLTHIQAETGQAVSMPDMMDILGKTAAWSLEDRQAWIRHFQTHLIPTLIFARAQWNEHKEHTK